MPTMNLSRSQSATYRIMRALGSGSVLTSGQISSLYGVRNVRATMSAIRRRVERYGNWVLESGKTSTGKTVYWMEFIGSNDNPFADGFDFDKQERVLDNLNVDPGMILEFS